MFYGTQKREQTQRDEKKSKEMHKNYKFFTSKTKYKRE